VFYVSISKEAMSKVIDHVKSAPDKEVIGVLIGKMDNDVLIVEDALSGKMMEDKKNVVMPGETLAKIADDIVNKKVKGNIIGWYHSHPGYGVFMSEVDNDTQSKLQQFSPYVVALVSDPSTGEFKFFSHDEKSKATQTLANSQIHFYGPGEASVPENFKGALQPRPPPTPPPPTVSAPREPLSRRQIYALISLVIIIAAVVTGVLLIIALSGPSGPSGSLKIDHNPVTSGLIGNDIKLIANATGGVGGVKNVIIYYKLSSDAAWKNDNMLLISKESNSYSYTIRGSDVTGNLDYYITASDTVGNQVTTPTTTIVIGDFEIDAPSNQLTVYVGQSKTTTITVKSINDFNSPVSLQAPNRPSVVASVSFSPTQVTPPKGGQATSTMTVTIVSSASTGEYQLTIQGSYGQVTRSMTITVLVSGFDISATPSSVTVQKGKTATYTVTLDIKKGFTDTVSFAVTGLPSTGIDQTNILVSNKKIATQGTTTLTVEIVTLSNVPAGTYSLNIVATGGGITQQETVTLIIQ
jgi:proteasome lid subunit RPN8/RPN11